MNILAVADSEKKALWDYYDDSLLKDVDLILSCGDLKAEYLEFLVTMANCPLLYVRGNHDDVLNTRPPGGCICIEDTVYNFHGLRILGLGGSMRYNQSPYMYTESRMKQRVWKLKWQLGVYEGFDVLVTHSPAAGHGDLEDLPHRGFECFNDLMEKYRPAYMLHGHVHREYGNFNPRMRHECGTEIINCCGYQIIDIPDEIITPRIKLARLRINALQRREARKENKTCIEIPGWKSPWTE